MTTITGRIVRTSTAGGGGVVPMPTVGQVVQNVAALRTLVGSASLPAVALAQYSSTLPYGGGGVFIWTAVAAADDGMTRFNAGGLGSSSAGWQRIAATVPDVTWAGAAADGNDDSAAFQRLLDAGGEVTIPAGTFSVQNLELPAWPTVVRLRGAGMRETVLRAYAPNVPIFKTPTAGTARSCVLEGFSVQAHSSGSTTPAIVIGGTNTNGLYNTIKDVDYLQPASGTGQFASFIEINGKAGSTHGNVLERVQCQDQLGPVVGIKLTAGTSDPLDRTNLNRILSPNFLNVTGMTDALDCIQSIGTLIHNPHLEQCFSDGNPGGTGGTVASNPLSFGDTTNVIGMWNEVWNATIPADQATFPTNGCSILGGYWGTTTLTIPAGVTGWSIVSPRGLAVTDNSDTAGNTFVGGDYITGATLSLPVQGTAVSGEASPVFASFTHGARVLGLQSTAAGYLTVGSTSNTPFALTQTGAVRFAVSTTQATLFLPTLGFDETQTNPALQQNARSTNAAAQSLTVQAQTAYASATGANKNGGEARFYGGLAVDVGTPGPFSLGIGKVGSEYELLRGEGDSTGEWLKLFQTGKLFARNGSPEAAVTAPVGSVYLRLDGGAGTTLYVKESGAGNTGWTAIGVAPGITSTATALVVNAADNAFGTASAGLELTGPNVVFKETSGGFITLQQRSTDAIPLDMKLQGGAAKTGAATHKDGGAAYLKGGAPAAGGIGGPAFINDGDDNTLFWAQQNKLSFYGHALASQQSVTGALSTVADAPAKAVLASIIAALVASGLITDGTT